MNQTTTFVLVVILALQVNVPAQDLAGLTSLWTSRQYEAALDGLLSYRDEAPFGRTHVVDYMIGTSACRIAGREADGSYFLTWVLDQYDIGADDRDKVQREIDNCTGGGGFQLVAELIAAEVNSTSGGTRGKMYYGLTDNPDLPIGNETVDIVRKITPGEFNSRLFLTGDPKPGLSALLARLGRDSRATATNAFLVASKHHSAAQLETIGQSLDEVLSFFLSQYELRRPPHYITVYLEENAWQLKKLAEKVHGFRVQSQSIGYSFRDDLSMVGAIPGHQIGTLLHELFHLVVRRDFGDIPPWLDEGISALYEVSVTRAGRTTGVPNWRGEVLKKLREKTPSLDRLVGMDWPTFDNRRDRDLGTQAANHATARYFALYLQDRGELVRVFQAFRERHPPRSDDGPAALLSDTLDRPIATLQFDFDRWLDRQLGVQPGPTKRDQ